MQSRRHFLITAAAGAATLIARPAGARTQVSGVYRRGVGDITVTALLDGYLALDPNMLTGSDPAENEKLLRAAFISGDKIETSVNAYLIEIGERRILVDGGAADAFGPTAGQLPAAFEAAELEPEKIDTIFCTHLHPDHVGAFTKEGGARFPNAEFVVNAVDHGFWTDDANFAGADEQTQAFVAAARGAVGAYQDRLKLVEDGADIAPGIRAMHLPGHTPGHTGLMLSSGDETLLIWADIVHLGPVQFARPALTIPFDVDQPMAAETRAKTLEMVAAERLEIAGAHIDFPSFGHVEKAGEGYHFTPSRWDHVL